MFDRVVGVIGSALHALATLCLILMFGLINAEVTLRYVFNRSTMISDEYSGYLFCWLVMLGLLAPAQQGLFLQVEFLTNRLSPGTRRWFQLFGYVAGFFVTAVLAYACYLVTTESYRFGSVSLQISETPIWIPQSIMVVGLGLLALYYLAAIIRHFVDPADREQGQSPLPLA